MRAKIASGLLLLVWLGVTLMLLGWNTSGAAFDADGDSSRHQPGGPLRGNNAVD